VEIKIQVVLIYLHSVFDAILGTIWSLSFSFATSGFLIIMTIYNLIKKLLSKKIHKGEIDKIFEDKVLTEMLTDFAIAEFSPENIYCFLDIKEFSTLTDDEEKLKFAEKMKHLYFNGMTSEYEVNLSGGTLKDFNEKMESHSWDELFSKIETSVRTNISDTYSRFIVSLEYQNYVISKDFQNSNINEMKTEDQITEKRSVWCQW
jgi:transcriptional regulator CtsR